MAEKFKRGDRVQREGRYGTVSYVDHEISIYRVVFDNTWSVDAMLCTGESLSLVTPSVPKVDPEYAVLQEFAKIREANAFTSIRTGRTVAAVVRNGGKIFLVRGVVQSYDTDLSRISIRTATGALYTGSGSTVTVDEKE